MKWKMGKDIGLISYDETPVKEIMLGGVTVIFTDLKKWANRVQVVCHRKITGR